MFSFRVVVHAAAGLALALATSARAQPAGNATPPPRPFEIVRMDPAFDALVAPGTTLETLVTIPGLNGEGPLWRKGRLWFSDQRNGPIYELGLDGKYRVVADKAGGPIDPNVRVNQGPNGEAAWRNGSVLVARQGLRDIGLMDKARQFTSFLATFEGKRFNSPNDMVVGRDGALWFTDPPFSLPGINDPPGGGPPPDKQIPFNGVFRFKDGKLTPVITDMERPNGIGLSPDGKVLYVANSRPEMYVRAYAVAKDGSLSNGRDFVRFADNTPFGRGVPDGLKVDSKGHVWLTGPGGIIVLAPSGKILGRIQLPANATNLAFGDDYRSVFVTSGPNVYRIRTLVKGQVPSFAER